MNGKSKGYGYVEFDVRDINAAVMAKSKLHGHILADCRISVAFASPERIKGAEYTNTPVHIPRQRHHHHHQNAHHPMAQSNVFQKMNAFPGPARILPSTNMPPHSMSASKTAIPVAANTNAAGGGNKGMSILSKFTDQAQLLELLKTSKATKKRSVSRSGSRSRSRSRSRSKGHRRRRHRDGGRSKRKERHRDRDRERGHGDVKDRERQRDRERKRHKRRHRHRYEDRERRKHRSRKRKEDGTENETQSDNVSRNTNDVPVTMTGNVQPKSNVNMEAAA